MSQPARVQPRARRAITACDLTGDLYTRPSSRRAPRRPAPSSVRRSRWPGRSRECVAPGQPPPPGWCPVRRMCRRQGSLLDERYTAAPKLRQSQPRPRNSPSSLREQERRLDPPTSYSSWTRSCRAWQSRSLRKKAARGVDAPPLPSGTLPHTAILPYRGGRAPTTGWGYARDIQAT